MAFLNIEIVLHLVALGVLAQQTLDVTLPWLWYGIVPLVAWSVYTLDRVIDVRSAKQQQRGGRHAFAARNQRTLVISAGIAMSIAVVTAVLAAPVWYWLVGICLGLLTLMHVVLQRCRPTWTAIAKDLNVAVVFTASAWTIPWAMALDSSHAAPGPDAYWTAAASLMTVMLNVLLLSRLDAAEDAALNLPSIAVRLGRRGTVRLAMVLAACTIVTAVLATLYGAPTRRSVVFGIIALVYLHSLHWPSRRIERTRLVLELVGTLVILAA